MFKEKHLAKLIFLTPIVTIGLLTLFTLSFFISMERANLNVESQSLEQKLLQQQKTVLVNEIQKVFQYFEYHLSMMHRTIDLELKDRVDDVHMMGINLFAKGSQSKSLQVLRQELLLMLSSLHVSGHRGYYFVLDAKGNILYPLEELGDRIGLQSAVHEALKHEGYATSEVGRPRRVYVKPLVSYGWSIGAAEYLDIATSRLKDEMISWSESLRYGEGGYMWIHNTTHTLLAHPFREESIGKDDTLLKDQAGNMIIQTFVKKALEKGDQGAFVEYFWRKPYEETPSKKISYVAQFKPWHWVVGTGVYGDDVQKEIALKKEEMKAKMDRYIFGVIVIALVSMLCVGFLSYLVTKQINRALESYRERVRHKTEALKEFNATLRFKINKALEESKQKDMALLQQSRLAQMGEMLSIIAHQWRQPLSEVSGIFMELETASKFGKADTKLIHESAKEADKLLSYMSRTIDDFRHFFKPSKEKESFWIQKACEEAFSLAQAVLKNSHIALHVKIFDSPKIEGYPNEYAQVILNLILNAKDILMERKVPEPQIWVEIGRTPEGNALVCVMDNGGGIKESNLKMVFEPYFSTKKASKGSGLGLYMAKMIIEQNMGGKIEVENAAFGAKFRVEVS